MTSKNMYSDDKIRPKLKQFQQTTLDMYISAFNNNLFAWLGEEQDFSTPSMQEFYAVVSQRKLIDIFAKVNNGKLFNTHVFVEMLCHDHTPFELENNLTEEQVRQIADVINPQQIRHTIENVDEYNLNLGVDILTSSFRIDRVMSKELFSVCSVIPALTLVLFENRPDVAGALLKGILRELRHTNQTYSNSYQKNREQWKTGWMSIDLDEPSTLTSLLDRMGLKDSLLIYMQNEALNHIIPYPYNKENFKHLHKPIESIYQLWRYTCIKDDFDGVTIDMASVLTDVWNNSQNYISMDFRGNSITTDMKMLLESLDNKQLLERYSDIELAKEVHEKLPSLEGLTKILLVIELQETLQKRGANIQYPIAVKQEDQLSLLNVKQVFNRGYQYDPQAGDTVANKAHVLLERVYECLASAVNEKAVFESKPKSNKKIKV